MTLQVVQHGCRSRKWRVEVKSGSASFGKREMETSLHVSMVSVTPHPKMRGERLSSLEVLTTWQLLALRLLSFKEEGQLA